MPSSSATSGTLIHSRVFVSISSSVVLRSALIKYVFEQLRDRVFKMSLDKIEQAVRNKLHESDKELADSHYLDAAVYRTLKNQRSSDTDDSLAVRAAQLVRKIRDETQPIELKSTSTDRIFGDALIRALAPKIGDLREAEFGRRQPPFSSVEEAATWIKRRSTEDLEGWLKNSKERNRAYDEIERMANEHQIEILFTSTLLPYLVPDDEHVKSADAIPGTYLYRLAKETERIAKHTGLPQEALVVHILTGLKPVRSRVRISKKESHYALPRESAASEAGEQLHVHEAAVTFRAHDLTDKELRSIYRMVKGHVGGKGTEPLDDKDEYLWGLVQDLGGPPRAHGTKGPFWRTVQGKTNAKYPGAYTTYKGVQDRYERIVKRLWPPSP